MYSSVLLARYIAAMANEREVTINVTKVQKLLYIAYGTHLALYGERLVDEQPQAWPYGPVFPKTRENLIRTPIWGLRTSDAEFADMRQDEVLSALLRLIFNTFGDWSATRLTEWSHKDNSPWHYAVVKGNGWGSKISDDFISPYFNSILRYERQN